MRWKRKADCHVQRLNWMCLKSWSLTSLRFSYKWALSLFGGSSRGVQLLVYQRCSSAGELVLFHRARSFGRDIHGAVREEGDTRLASQISRINPSDQWGDRCRSQIALTSTVQCTAVQYINHDVAQHFSVTVSLQSIPYNYNVFMS